MRAAPALVLAGALLSGCLLPDRFEATLDLGPQRATLDYRGELVVMPAYADAAKLSAADDEKMVREALDAVAADVRHDGGSVDYAPLGKGRVKAVVVWTQALPPVEGKTTFADLVAIRRHADGALEIVTPALTDRDRTQLTKMGLGDAAGRLCVTTTGTVVESNAPAKPEAAGGCHGWSIAVLKDAPVRMVVRF